MGKITICDMCRCDTYGHYWIVGSRTLCDGCFQRQKEMRKDESD